MLMVKIKKNMNIVFFFEKMIKNLFYIIKVNRFYIKCVLYIEMIEIVVNINLVIIIYMYYLKFILNY